MGQTNPVMCLGQIMSQSSDGDAYGYHMREAGGAEPFLFPEQVWWLILPIK